MKVSFYLGHPAHYHLFSHLIKSLLVKEIPVLVLIKDKDVLKELLEYDNIKYKTLISTKKNLLFSTFKQYILSFYYNILFRPSILIGTTILFGPYSKLFGVPNIIVNEDDSIVVPQFAKLAYPLASIILSPAVCNNGKWNEKSIKIESYHELSYLHPNSFKPSKSVVNKYITNNETYFIIRFANLVAHHDENISGLNIEVTNRIISLLKPYGRIYITSEKKLNNELEQYRISINPMDIHHVMAFAKIYIGDSQTMAAEAGVLGVPFIRFNDFVGRISYLDELEKKYHLGFGIKPDNPEMLFSTLEELLTEENLSAKYQNKRKKMLSDKIDYSKFLEWFISNYPQSVDIIKVNPDIQYNLP